jgi:hypothetical protein
MMSPSASARISRECSPLVRFGGSYLTPAVRDGWSQSVPPPLCAHRFPVSNNRLSPSPRAAMPGFACAVRTPARAFFYSVQVVRSSGPLLSSARSGRDFGAVGHVREAKS